MAAPAATLSWRNEIGRLFRLAGPLIVNNLSIAGMQFADAVMSGRLGASTLAAVAVGGSVWFFFFAFMLGVLMAISPISARLYGAGKPEQIGRYTRQGIYLGLAAAIPVMLLAHTAVPVFLEYIGIDAGFRELTIGYIKAISFGSAGMFAFLALRFTTEGVGVTLPIMVTSLLALVFNVFLNWVFMYGKLGFPAMGAIGCGYASATTMWIIAIALFLYMARARVYRGMQLFDRLSRPRLAELSEIAALGIPIAITITAEAGLFNAVALLMGTRGTEITAAHQIAINFAATMFMVPLALSSAITIRIGHELGALEFERARYAGGFGIVVCGAFMTFSALNLFVFRDAVVSLYTDDPIVQGIAISLLFMAAIFQVADGVQIGAAGALRGYKDTKLPMIINTFAYWALGFPLAYLAAVVYVMDPAYVWGGFVLGLSVAAVLLTWRYARISKTAIATLPVRR